MNITHVRSLTVPVSDQDAAKEFYAGTLGFEVVADQAAGPIRWLQLAPRGRGHDRRPREPPSRRAGRAACRG
ncbi:VOC family protein [Actinomadura madurae]|uniref:VOC family protein n=1 Tax=Actinomadura madurae TaxID=1993 RepID=UPI0020D20798|nr:VOC family protein [Actinomadura madurae]MCP9979615.1 VOC family protein [Actinomadura madurae]